MVVKQKPCFYITKRVHCNLIELKRSERMESKAEKTEFPVVMMNSGAERAAVISMRKPFFPISVVNIVSNYRAISVYHDIMQKRNKKP